MIPQRLIIIGLDGVPFPLLQDLTQNGVMPNTGKIIQNGFSTPMLSTVPEISSVAWSSIITGANPAEHGIYGFIEMHPNSYNIRFPNFNDLKAPTFWDKSREKSVIINVPSTYPVKDMNGVHISGFVSIDINKSVHPTFLIPELENMNYRLDVDSEKAHSDLEFFAKDLDETLTARIKAADYLWDYVDWRAFMLVFTGTDRLMHFLWSAYDDKNHKFHNIFIEHFRRIDTAIGNIVAKLSDNDALIMLSDHGFEKLEKDVYINHLLVSEGFLTFKPNTDPKPVNIDCSTKAFSMDPARIYINEKGKYPAGSIEPADKDRCLKDLENLFSSLEIEGKKVIRHIFRTQDIYSGPYLDSAPDMILIGEKGFNLRGSMAAKQLASNSLFTGKHNYEEAFLVTSDKNMVSTLPEQPSVIDAGKLIQDILKS